METVPTFLSELAPSESVLLILLSRRIDDSMLRDIAAADYGFDLDAHLAALLQIRDWADIPAPMEWEPREVLRLVRWSSPEDPDTQGDCSVERDHLMRAFCCTALLMAAADPKNRDYFDDENETVAPLLASALALGDEVSNAMLRFLCWRVDVVESGEPDRPFFAMAILMLCTSLSVPGDDSQLIELVEWVEREEAWARAADWLPYESEQWLLGVAWHRQSHHIWRKLGHDILLTPPPHLLPESTAAVQRLGELLHGAA